MELSSSSRYHPQLFSLISPLGRRRERALKGALTINNFSFCQGMKFLILITVYNYNFWIYGTKTPKSYHLLRRGRKYTVTSKLPLSIPANNPEAIYGQQI